MSEFLDLCRQAAEARPEDIAPGHGTVLLLAPHPDDETLGCGAAIAALAQAGRPVQVVLVTDGAASHPRSRLYDRQRLAATRRAELRAALRELAGEAARPVIELGYPDLAAPDSEAEIAAAADRIARLLPDAPAAIWTTWQGDPHPDHERCARLAARLARACPGTPLWAYPIWGRFDSAHPLPAPGDIRLLRLPQFAARKTRAIRAHASQMSDLIPDDPEGFAMPEEMQAHFANHPEIFIRISPDDP